MRTRAAAYEQSARWFRAQADEVMETAGTVARSLPTGVLAGGAVRDVLDDTLGTTVQNCRRVADELQALAIESARRAQVCRDYEDAVARYDTARRAWLTVPVDERAWRGPVMPSPPAPWVPA